MKRIFGLMLALSLTTLSASAVWGSAAGFGARAVGMGGAYTAIADDESAAYWNPAGIVQTKHLRFAAGGGYHGEFDKLRNAIEDIRDEKVPNREDLVGDYSATVLVGLTAKHIGLNFYSDNFLTTTEDSNHTINGNMTSTNYGVATIAGRLGKSKKLAVGINLKAVAAGYGEIKIPALPNMETITPDEIAQIQSYEATSAYDTATGIACDFGFIYQLSSKLNLGFNARNLYLKLDSDTGTKTTHKYQYDPVGNTASLVTTQADYNYEIKVPKSLVVGLAFKPFNHTVLAADVENITNTDNDNDQTRLHVGLEQNALWNLLSLRAGYFTYKDAAKEDATGYTAGVGFNLWIINCSAACVKTDDDKSYMATANIKF